MIVTCHQKVESLYASFLSYSLFFSISPFSPFLFPFSNFPFIPIYLFATLYLYLRPSTLFFHLLYLLVLPFTLIFSLFVSFLSFHFTLFYILHPSLFSLHHLSFSYLCVSKLSPNPLSPFHPALSLSSLPFRPPHTRTRTHTTHTHSLSFLLSFSPELLTVSSPQTSTLHTRTLLSFSVLASVSFFPSLFFLSFSRNTLDYKLFPQ